MTELGIALYTIRFAAAAEALRQAVAAEDHVLIYSMLVEVEAFTERIIPLLRSAAIDGLTADALAQRPHNTDAMFERHTQALITIAGPVIIPGTPENDAWNEAAAETYHGGQP